MNQKGISVLRMRQIHVTRLCSMLIHNRSRASLHFISLSFNLRPFFTNLAMNMSNADASLFKIPLNLLLQLDKTGLQLFDGHLSEHLEEVASTLELYMTCLCQYFNASEESYLWLRVGTRILKVGSSLACRQTPDGVYSHIASLLILETRREGCGPPEDREWIVVMLRTVETRVDEVLSHIRSL